MQKGNSPSLTTSTRTVSTPITSSHFIEPSTGTSSVISTPVSTPTITTSGPALTSTTASRSKVSSTSLSGTLPKSSTSLSPSPTSTSIVVSAGVPKGAAAGIGVGCAAVGALLALVILLFMGRRRKSTRSSSRFGLLDVGVARDTNSDSYGGPKQQRISERTLPKYEEGLPINVNNPLDSILPQPLADDSIKQEVSGLFTMIEGHAVNYYHEERLSKYMPAIKDTLLPAAVSSQKNVVIDQLLAEPRTRISTISSIICGKLLENVSLSGDTKETLLPSAYAYFLHSLASQPDTSHAAQLSLSRWRVSSMFLRGSQPLAGEQDHRAQAVRKITEDLDQILASYVAPQGAHRRVKDLDMLCERAAKVGMIILSQPARWEFAWRLPSKYRAAEQRGGARGARTPLVMFPGLVRTTDNSAKPLDRSRSFMEPSVQQ